MKKNLLFLLIICCSHSVFAQEKVDMLHYRYEIELNDKSDTLYGKATVTAFAKKGTNVLLLDLSGDRSGKQKGMIVTDARTYFNDAGHIREMPSFIHANGKLIVNLRENLPKDDTVFAVIKYKGIPDDGLIISKNKYGNRTFFSDNWPNRAHHWIPCVDRPDDKATVEFIVTAPAHYGVISNGKMTEEKILTDGNKRTHYKEDVALPTKVMVIGVADFAVDSVGMINNVPVYSWVFPENKKDGFYDYALAKDILGFYMDYIGPYAYEKLANVQSKTIFGGMENASAIFYYENSITGKRTEEALLAHEIVHQWFGNMATEKSFAHLWLSEGFATYLTHYYIEKRYGKDSLEKRMQKDRQQVLDFVRMEKRPVVDTTADYMQLLNANSYQKGGWILHMLRRELGDETFQKSVRKYYEHFAGKNAETHDLQKIFEEGSGKKLDKFFEQWLHSPVNPKLQLRWKYLPQSKKLEIDVEQLQEGTVFHFPLEIELNNSGKKTVLPLSVQGYVQHFSLAVPEKPSSIRLDPNTSLLFEGTVSEMK